MIIELIVAFLSAMTTLAPIISHAIDVSKNAKATDGQTGAQDDADNIDVLIPPKPPVV